jgi:hypothetical protein
MDLNKWFIRCIREELHPTRKEMALVVVCTPVSRKREDAGGTGLELDIPTSISGIRRRSPLSNPAGNHSCYPGNLLPLQILTEISNFIPDGFFFL